MKNNLTEGLQNVTITEIKRNYSEYPPSNEPTLGLGKGEGDITLENILVEETPDQKAIREEQERTSQILINAEGNEVDGNGKVLRTKEQIDSSNQETPEQKLEREKLEAEQNQVVLDTEGNQIDKEGKIIKTKEVLAQEALELENSQTTLIEDVINTSGVVILDEDGKPKVYEDSVEGVIQYSNDLAEFKAKENEKELFNVFPQVKKYLEAQIKGITDEEYFGNKLTDWKAVKLDKENEAQQLDTVIKEYQSRGIEKDRAIKMANRLKDSGKDVLFEESEIALKSLQDTQDAVETAKNERIAAEQQRQEEVAKQHWTKVESTILSGKIGEYVIPEVDRKAFNDYVSLSADSNGNSAAMLARAKQTLEQKLLLDYYMFKGMDFNGLVKTSINNQKVQNLKNRIPKANNNSSQNNNTNQSNQSINFNDIKLENVQR